MISNYMVSSYLIIALRFYKMIPCSYKSSGKLSLISKLKDLLPML